MNDRSPLERSSIPEFLSQRPEKTSPGAWLALTAALLGWLFDGAEMGVFSLVGRPAVRDLLAQSSGASPAENQIALWLGVITSVFLVGAATGGVVFGWLGDRIGRVRAMTASVICYALFTSLGGLAHTPLQLGVLRFIAALGMGGEWSLGVALVMESFPNRSRAFMAGLIGAAANIGYLLVGVVGLTVNAWLGSLESWMTAWQLPEWLIANKDNQGWRVIMILGIFPALLTFFIRLFVPESREWEAEKKKGRTGHWATVDMLAVVIGALGPGLMVYAYAFPNTGALQHTFLLRVVVTIVGILVAIIGYLYPVHRYLQRSSLVGSDLPKNVITSRMLLGAMLSGIALLGTWGAIQQSPSWAHKLAEAQTQVDGIPRNAKEYMLIWMSAGAALGAFLAAWSGNWFGRRATYCVLCVLAFISVQWLFHGNREFGTAQLVSVFIAGACSASFYGWLPLYLPELFPTCVRATGQGFGFNFGRIIAAVGSLQLGNLVGHFASGLDLGPWRLAGGYPIACSLLSMIYIAGMVLIWFAPETRIAESSRNAA